MFEDIEYVCLDRKIDINAIVIIFAFLTKYVVHLIDYLVISILGINAWLVLLQSLRKRL